VKKRRTMLYYYQGSVRIVSAGAHTHTQRGSKRARRRKKKRRSGGGGGRGAQVRTGAEAGA
jgi:hypothetical protein